MTSRIGKVPVTVPSGVEVNINGSAISVKGEKGELDYTVPAGIKVEQDGDQLNVIAENEEGQTVAFHGLARSLVANMIEGVTNGFSKRLSIVGTGYRATQKGGGIEVAAGYSHPVFVKEQEGVTLKVEDSNLISVSGIDKQRVGEVAARIRKIRPPEPYKGKGIRYQNEVVRRKAGKAGK
jgi:large subunit ribosomal protein L6